MYSFQTLLINTSRMHSAVIIQLMCASQLIHRFTCIITINIYIKNYSAYAFCNEVIKYLEISVHKIKS